MRMDGASPGERRDLVLLDRDIYAPTLSQRSLQSRFDTEAFHQLQLNFLPGAAQAAWLLSGTGRGAALWLSGIQTDKVTKDVFYYTTQYNSGGIINYCNLGFTFDF